jgi:hypothetical protein
VYGSDACGGTRCLRLGDNRLINVLFDCVPGLFNKIKVWNRCSDHSSVCTDGSAGKSDTCELDLEKLEASDEAD